MTKKDFELIANSLSTTKPSGPKTAINMWGIIVAHLAAEFKHKNPRFDKDIFFKACGYPDYMPT